MILPRAPRPGRPPAAAGQTMIFMVVALVILAAALAWVFDVHSILHLKARAQNAGDAAALAAARWQALSLNLVGDLNILQALAVAAGDTNASARISDTQARLCFAGPLVGLLAAQQAAKNNRFYSHAEFTAQLQAHAALVGQTYAAETNVFPEPYPGAWADYGGMLSNLAAQGVSAGPDNTRYFSDVSSAHWLLGRGFYEAVAGRDWCWFYWNGMALLQTYLGVQSWPPLPSAPAAPDTANSEIFGLDLAPWSGSLPGGAAAVPRIDALRAARGLGDTPVSNAAAGAAATWYRYRWTAWTALAPAQRFPVLPLRVKPDQDYAGADAVVRVEAPHAARRSAPMPGLRPFLARTAPAAAALEREVAPAPATWTAAAKPIGSLSADGRPVRPDAYGLVLPAFRRVRLIPVDAATAATAAAYDLAWRTHITEHLDLYLQSGPAGLDAGCWYCQQLMTWETPAFRQEGALWLSDTNNVCEHRHGGPGGPGGGTRRGH